MLKYYKNGIYFDFKGNVLPVFLEFSQYVEQNCTGKLRNTSFPFISEVPTTTRLPAQQ